MLLYDSSIAPSPRRVRIYLAEKGIEVPRREIDVRAGEQFATEFEQRNPDCTVPVLELDDGTCISESMAICRYFEALYPDPPLMGVDALDQATVEMWNRRVEQQGYQAAADVFRNSAEMFHDRALPGARDGVPQIPRLAARARDSLRRFLERLDHRLAESELVAGPRFTVADITALVTVDAAARLETLDLRSLPHLARWHETVSARPSASA